MTGTLKSSYKTPEVDSFVARHSTEEGKGPQAVLTFRDGTQIKRRDVFKRVATLQLQASGGDTQAMSSLALLAGADLSKQVLNPQKLDFSEAESVVKYDLKAEVQQTVAKLRELPRLSLAVYVGLYCGLYAEPGFSDVTAEDIAKRLKLDVSVVKGALSNLHTLGLVFRDEMNGQVFQHPTIWSNPQRCDVTLSGMGFTQDEVDELISDPLGSPRAVGGKPKNKEENMVDHKEIEAEAQEPTEETQELRPIEGFEVLPDAKDEAARKPKKAAVVRELTPEEVAARDAYIARYGKRGDKELDLAHLTKTGAPSRMSLEARARMSAAAKARWQDPEKAAALRARFAERKAAAEEGKAEREQARKAAQEQRRIKREAQLASERERKAAQEAKKLKVAAKKSHVASDKSAAKGSQPSATE